MRNTILILSSLAMSAGLLLAADAKVDLSKIPAASDKKGLTYAKEIKPILEKSCFGCHGPEKQKGKLRFDTLEAALKGGDGGKVIEPGKSDKSPLLASIARLDPDAAMPPEGKGDPLTKDQVGLIRAWIEQGAK
jgi:mono/diheme cytochrome c family protein